MTNEQTQWTEWWYKFIRHQSRVSCVCVCAFFLHSIPSFFQFKCSCKQIKCFECNFMWFWCVQNWRLHWPFVSFQGKVAIQMSRISIFSIFESNYFSSSFYFCFSIVFVNEMFIRELFCETSMCVSHSKLQCIETKRINFWLCTLVCLSTEWWMCDRYCFVKFTFQDGAHWNWNWKS